MSLLFKHFYDGDLDRFRALLAPPSGHSAQSAARSPIIGGASGGHGSASSPGGLFATSPRSVAKSRRTSGWAGASSGSGRHGATGLSKSEVNARDHAGLTILLRAASSTAPDAIAYVRALLDHPATDMYAQDPESGWNCLHRALYAGNISVARLLLDKERKSLTDQVAGASLSRVGQLIKTKDHEGNSPFDLFNSTIGARGPEASENASDTEDESDFEDLPTRKRNKPGETTLQAILPGDELFAFGSNKNMSLGLGDEDDRQFPERVYLQRPEHLFETLYGDLCAKREDSTLNKPISDASQYQAMILDRPLLVRDVALSKLHSAVLTNDPLSNLYLCGVGRGGRLGLGDENTRFNYVPVQGGLADRSVVKVALGLNHTMAVTSLGELWTWGSNSYSQLGYTLPHPGKDEEPVCTTPRQVFGPLKKEYIIGVAASAIHSVVHTESSLYAWGKNVGQLALMDADSRSLEVQTIPRKVAASLISSPIVMVSAIDKATICLLENHTVICFTSYGYNIIKFPFAETFTNHHLRNISMSTRYEATRNQIQYVASGGETIAAVTGRGDLFTFGLNKVDVNAATTSTTNPSKIKSAVTQPQCVWIARREGVRSVGVGENGSVIISTESGAVWRRIKRAKAKDAYVTGSSEVKRKDFKFQRVPYITKVVTVRASPFGAFAAVRSDLNVMKEQIPGDSKTLWADIRALNPLRGFMASEPGNQDKEMSNIWNAVKTRRNQSVADEIIKSPDLTVDIERHLKEWAYQNEPLDAAICTSSSPDLKLPIHGWLLTARSSILRNVLAQFRRHGSYEHAEGFKIDKIGGTTVIMFANLDLMSVLNLIVYMYEDRVIPAWSFTRQAPSLAYRYRQIRSEVMKTATRLGMQELETAVRSQAYPNPSMDFDFRKATRDRSFFDDGDVLLELDGMEVPVHSALICQRCHWFDNLFHGRSGGMWLAGRRELQDEPGPTRIDLKHMEPPAFKFVLQHLYSDAGEEIFDDVVSPSLEDFTDLVMDVLSIANELMLDRLSRACQRVMGKVVNTRNVAHLLNAISPCSVTAFKDATMEYICLQMETMLENHLIDELEDDLMFELDEHVRENQLARLPFVRSGRTELLLHELYPDLAEDIEEERQRRAREIVFKAVQKEEERKVSSSLKGRFGSLEDSSAAFQTPDSHRKSSKAKRNEPFSPDLRPKDAHADLMFTMDDDDSHIISSPLTKPKRFLDPIASSALDETTPISPEFKPTGVEMHVSSPPSLPAGDRAAFSSKTNAEATSRLDMRPGNPWGSSVLTGAKMDLGEIIKSESSTHRSALSAGLAPQTSKDLSTSSKPAQTKMSQKERKKQQQMQSAPASAETQLSTIAWDPPATKDLGSPWKLASVKGKTPAIGLLAQSLTKPSTSTEQGTTADAVSKTSLSRRTASPDTRFSGQSRTPSSSAIATTNRPPPRTSLSAASSGSLMPPKPATSTSMTPSPQSPKPLIPHSKSYITHSPKAEPELGLSMTEIIGQQQREQQIVREQVAKRSLQEIQQEQAFQEWWDAESRRTQDEESRRLHQAEETKKGPSRRGRGGRQRGGGGRSGTGDSAVAGSASGVPAETRVGAGKGKGKRGGRGGGGALAAGAGRS